MADQNFSISSKGKDIATNNFLQNFILRPYGNNLLSNGGKINLSFMVLAVLIVASVEALSWSYMLLSSGYFKIAIALGLIWFFAMLVIDFSIVTANTLEDEHRHNLDPYKKELYKSSIKNKYFSKIYFGFVLRLIVAFASLYATSGFMTQFFFEDEIQQAIEKKSIENKNNAVLGVDKKWIPIIEKIDKEIIEATQKRDDQANGKMGSGKSGYGNIAKRYQQDIDELKKEKKDEEEKRDIEKNEAKNKAGELSVDSQTFRQEALNALEENISFKQRKIIIEIFLLILAVILIIMKFSQGRDLNLYYSTQLQGMWELYKTGAYDQYLPENDRSKVLLAANFVSAEQFERIALNYVQDIARQEDEVKKARLYKEELDQTARARQQEIDDQHEEEKLRLVTKAIEDQKIADGEAEDERQHLKKLKEEADQRKVAIEALHEAEKLRLEIKAIEDKKNAEAEAEVEHLRLKQEAEELQQLQQAQAKEAILHEKKLALGMSAHQLRLAKEQAFFEKNKKDIDFETANVKEGLSRLKVIEDMYFERHQDELDQLNQQESALNKQLSKMQKDYRTQEKKLEAFRMSILQEEQQYRDTQISMRQATQREDSYKPHVLQLIESYANALSRKDRLIDNKKEELRVFEADQKFYIDDCNQVRQELKSLQDRRQNILKPHDEIIAKRAELESHFISLTGREALLLSPYQAVDDLELPFLAEKIRHSVNFKEEPVEILKITYQPEQ